MSTSSQRVSSSTVPASSPVTPSELILMRVIQKSGRLLATAEIATKMGIFSSDVRARCIHLWRERYLTRYLKYEHTALGHHGGQRIKILHWGLTDQAMAILAVTPEPPLLPGKRDFQKIVRHLAPPRAARPGPMQNRILVAISGFSASVPIRELQPIFALSRAAIQRHCMELAERALIQREMHQEPVIVAGRMRGAHKVAHYSITTQGRDFLTENPPSPPATAALPNTLHPG